MVIVFATAANFYKPIFGYTRQSKCYFLHAAIHLTLIMATLIAFYGGIIQKQFSCLISR
jgi:hypothetical protein